MKLLGLSVVLSALQAVDARDPACRPAAPSCRFVSPWTARECSAIIHSHHIRLSTCEAPEKTITKTVVVTHHPTFTHTKTVKPSPSTKTTTKVITQTDPVTQKDTTTAWATATAVSTTTTVTSDFTTATTTTTSVETETDSTTVTTTQDVTTTVSWAPEVCTPTVTLAPTLAPSKRSDKRNDYRIPRDCSCFLTSTKSCGPRATKVVTRIEEDRPRYITKTVTDRRKFETVTITKTSITHINGAPPPKQTVTSTTTSTVITTATSTSTVEQTTTATEATTTTVVESATVTTTHPVTATEDPCNPANVNKYLLSGPPSNPNVVLGFRGDGNNNPGICCQNCVMNADCVYWKLSAGGSICEGYFTSRTAPVEGCTTNACRRGHPFMAVSPQSDGNTYGMGQCGVFGVAF
ncbi:uncharacterized protein TRIREDRAFT_123976 [Trichoderma reesei QM6a]|uniref:Predicted protein n=1 Tax=Hypocrea jecorina (strain QM6a) TaxID=431241 RepID=G0RVH0_HYPJQ|nr:uncharacterized protein TRIREDRAFT_123976 [Trichoderma reesei QM6a]EGR44868.1 predicted protein [Trichoderma reesei QM6a]